MNTRLSALRAKYLVMVSMERDVERRLDRREAVSELSWSDTEDLDVWQEESAALNDK